MNTASVVAVDTSYVFNFMSNGVKYSGLSAVWNINSNNEIVVADSMYYGSTLVIANGEWENQKYRTITILGSIVDYESLTQIFELAEILKANATKQKTAPEYQFTVQSKDGTQTATYTFRQGMTWEDFVNSEYNVNGYFTWEGYEVKYIGFENINPFNVISHTADVYISAKTYILMSFSGGTED